MIGGDVPYPCRTGLRNQKKRGNENGKGTVCQPVSRVSRCMIEKDGMNNKQAKPFMKRRERERDREREEQKAFWVCVCPRWQWAFETPHRQEYMIGIAYSLRGEESRVLRARISGDSDDNSDDRMSGWIDGPSRVKERERKQERKTPPCPQLI